MAHFLRELLLETDFESEVEWALTRTAEMEREGGREGGREREGGGWVE